MDSLLQLIQIALVILATAAAIFAGQFSRMRREQFNEVCKFMLIVSAVLVIGSDLLNYIPAVQLSSLGLGTMFVSGGISGYVISYGIVGLLLYTGCAYAFSYYMLTKERLQQVYDKSEEIVLSFQQRQAGIAAQQAEPEDDATAKLQRLHALREKGIISEQEFKAKKEQILGL